MHDWSVGYGGTLLAPERDVLNRVRAIKSLSRRKPIKSILDFGSGNGQMISALSDLFDIQGVEPEDKARRNCIEKGMKVSESAEPLLNKSEKFDLITLFHVIEHFYNPIVELKRILKLLGPGGILLVETPNSEDVLLTTYESMAFRNFTYWSHHPMLHSSVSLINLVTTAGFKSAECQQIQRYGLANHLHWLAKAKPGGHISWGGKFSRHTEFAYAADLIAQGRADTLWLIADT